MTLPLENLSDKRFEDLVKEALSRIAVYAPAWTDHNKTDPGITLIEMLAWLSEIQIYRLNRIQDESYKNFLKLIHEQSSQENLDILKNNARADLKKVSRAVTPEDYENLARQFLSPGSRVKAIPRYHPKARREVPNAVTLVIDVDQKDTNGKDEDLKGLRRELYWHLDEYRLLTTELFIVLPSYVDISIDAAVVKKVKYDSRLVEDRVRKRLMEFLDPARGGPDSRGWPFGRPVYLSEIYEAIDGVEGVDYVCPGLKINGMISDKIDIPLHALVRSASIKVNCGASCSKGI